MNDGTKNPPKGEAHDRHHARKRRARRDAISARKTPQRKRVEREESERLLLYGLHTVSSALQNQLRRKITLYASPNALVRLDADVADLANIKVQECHPRDLDKLVGSEAVHQGVVLHCSPLPPKRLSELKDGDLLLILDQVTDPHNVGAIMRSAVAMDAAALITTSRYSPVESGVLAKSASGALDMIDHIEVRNLADTLEELHQIGFTTIGLDSEGNSDFVEIDPHAKVALVLGSEGKGLRQKTRLTCNHLARLDMPGKIKSLNVSNAAALALYLTRQSINSNAQK